jgi:hypothetical protein
MATDFWAEFKKGGKGLAGCVYKQGGRIKIASSSTIYLIFINQGKGKELCL